LAVAKVISDEWYRKALKAARFFTEGQHTEKTLTHKILRGSYRVFRAGSHSDKLHGSTLLEALYELGIPSWVDQSQLANHLSTYGIKPRQIKINGLNRNGYDWHYFLKAFSTYITKEEEEEIEIEIGIRREVEVVDVVDGSGISATEYRVNPDTHHPLPSTASTCSTNMNMETYSTLPSTLSTSSTGVSSLKDFARILTYHE
jgi:hypothetical protein